MPAAQPPSRVHSSALPLCCTPSHITGLNVWDGCEGSRQLVIERRGHGSRLRLLFLVACCGLAACTGAQRGTESQEAPAPGPRWELLAVGHWVQGWVVAGLFTDEHDGWRRLATIKPLPLAFSGRPAPLPLRERQLPLRPFSCCSRVCVGRLRNQQGRSGQQLRACLVVRQDAKAAACRVPLQRRLEGGAAEAATPPASPASRAFSSSRPASSNPCRGPLLLLLRHCPLPLWPAAPATPAPCDPDAAHRFPRLLIPTGTSRRGWHRLQGGQAQLYHPAARGEGLHNLRRQPDLGGWWLRVEGGGC